MKNNLLQKKKFPDFEATYNWVKPSVKDKNGNPINIDLTPRINFLFYNNKFVLKNPVYYNSYIFLANPEKYI